MVDISDKKFYSGDDISKMLEIAESTVRKYALIIENVGWSFSKNENNARAFIDADVELFEMILELRKDLNVSLEKAVDMSVAYHLRSISVTHDVSDANNLAVEQNKNNFLQEYRSNQQLHKENFESFNEGQDILISKVNEVIDENQELKEMIAELIEEKKKPWFKKIFG